MNGYNNFYNLDGTPYTIPGLIINSSGGSPNEVYNNYFNELSVATIAIGSNSSFWGKSNIPISYTTGLKYKCNEYGDNIYDIAVVNGEIASLQGEQEDDFYVPAGNTFEHNYINNGYDCEFYIYNSFPSSEFFYCYDPNNLETKPFLTEFSIVNYIFGNIPGYVQSEACPSLVNKPLESLEIISNRLLTQNAAITAFESELNSLIDGGQTEVFLERIATLTPKTYASLCQDLIGIAPYASGQVLVEFMKNTFKGQPNKKRDVLLANSPLPRDAKAELPNTWLPPPFMQQVVQQQTGVSVVDESYAKLADMKADRIKLLQEAIDLTLQNDTLPEYSDSLITLLSNEDEYYSKMLLISYYNRIGIYDMASQALTELEALITELPEMQQVQLLQYITLQEILSEIRLNPDSLTSVVNSNLTFLEIEAGSRNPYTYIGAQLLLEQAGIRDYPERILLPFEPAISKDLSIEGTVIENPDCGGMPVVGLTLLLLDESLQPVVDVSPAVTDSSGGFKFDYFNIKNLNNTDYYYIMPEQCFTLQSNPLRTLAEWKFDDNIVLTLADVNRYWVKTYSETDSLYNIGTAIDMNGNIYVAGTTKTLATEYDYAVIKYSPTGEQLWAIKYAGEGSDWVSDMVVDNGGNCYVTGWSQNSDGDYDYLTVKYNISGVEQWTARYNGAASIDNYDIANSIAVDGNGNVYVTGASIGINIGKDILTIKYNNIGEQIWVKEYDSGYANDIGSVVKVDNAGNIIVAGTTYNINGNADYKFIKYAPDGSQICTGTYNYGSHDMLQAMTLDNKGNIIVTGASMSASYDYATVKFDLSGNILWIKRYGSAITDYPYDIASDDLGNIYVTGTCNNDYVTIKYDVDGIQQWASAYYYGANYIDVANAIDIDYKGNVYVTGMSWPATLKSGEIVTVKYSPYGIQEWSDTYYYVTNTRINQGNDIVVSQNNNVYITGYAWNGNNIDIITIKYSECFTTAHLKAGYSDISNPDIIINNESEKNISVKPPESYFYIFPNPNDGNMQLEYSFASGYDGKLIVRNLQGVEVDNYYLSGKSNRAWINTGNMPNGIYFYTLYEGSQKIKIGKIIIVK